MMLKSAISYAERGWPVFPVHVAPSGPGSCSCRNPECSTNAGKHPIYGGGLNSATTETAMIIKWWTARPDANIGIRTGIGFDVLDLDGETAMDSLDAYMPDAAPIVGPMVRTGRGIHIYMAAKAGKSRNGILSKVDYKGAGGYVIAPPSLHVTGHRYQWTDLHADHALHEPPGWLIELVHGVQAPRISARPQMPAMQQDRYGEKAFESEMGRLLLAREGGRNEQLNKSAHALGQLVAAGRLDARRVITELLFAAERIGLTTTEAERTITSGLNAGARQPRQVAS